MGRGLANRFIHGHSNKGGRVEASPTYRSWKAMKTRCKNNKHTFFDRYGGRGIGLDPRWENFESFLQDMGIRPEGLTLERIDNDKGYSKENCRWVTRKQQANNRRSSRWLELDGLRMTLQQWADHTGIARTAIRDRLKRGWPLAKAVSVPVQQFQ